MNVCLLLKIVNLIYCTCCTLHVMLQLATRLFVWTSGESRNAEVPEPMASAQSASL